MPLYAPTYARLDRSRQNLRREKGATGGGFLGDPDTIISRVYIRRNRTVNNL